MAMTLLREHPGSFDDLDLNRDYTIDEFLELNLDGVAELVDGKIILNEMGYTNSIHAALITWFSKILSCWADQSDWGLIMAGDADIQTRSKPGRIRGADLICISYDRYSNVTRKGVIIDVGPELVIEVISPSNTWEDIQTKVREYFSIGSDEVWVVSPKAKDVTVYLEPNRSESFSVDDHEVLSAKSLAGFQMSLNEMAQLIDRLSK